MTEESTELVAYDTALFPKLLDQDPQAVMERFARRFMAAETLEDLFSVMEGNVSKDMIGRVVTIRSVAYAPFHSDRGIIVNAICDAVDAKTGEVLEFATTGEVLTMFIRRAELTKNLPVTVRIAGKKTNSGQTALNFERP
jgi:hypothetical protein